jgi:uncharacterized protein
LVKLYYICNVDKIKLEIIELSPSQLQTGSFTLLLSEVKGSRKLPIIIGMFEAQAIVMEIEKVSPTRPLTHDLFRSFAKSFDYFVEEVQITDISEGVFYSKIICTDGIRQKTIDARPSDAVAIAVRFEAPIYTIESVLQEAGLSSDDLEEPEDKPQRNVKVKAGKDSSTMNLEDLQKALDQAIKNEEYEKAAKIRDEIEKRN